MRVSTVQCHDGTPSISSFTPHAAQLEYRIKVSTLISSLITNSE